MDGSTPPPGTGQDGATMSKAKKRNHRWCGAIKDTHLDTEACSGSGELGFDLWLYHAGAGWWLEEGGIASSKKAASMMEKSVGKGNTVAGAILPAGQHLGLFTKRWDRG
jgi:hypothetical protein